MPRWKRVARQVARRPGPEPEPEPPGPEPVPEPEPEPDPQPEQVDVLDDRKIAHPPYRRGVQLTLPLGAPVYRWVRLMIDLAREEEAGLWRGS